MDHDRANIPIRCIIERVSSNSVADKESSESNSLATGGRSLNDIGLAGSVSSGSSLTPNSSSSGSGNGPTISSSPCSSSINGISPMGQAASESVSESITGNRLSHSPNQSTSACLTKGSVVEQDSFAIITSSVPLSDLVRTALQRLGYSSSEIPGAKGYIQLRNWKPLKFEQITDSLDATVGDIMGDISSTAILRIVLYRPKTNANHELEDKLIQFISAHPYSLLINSGCSIDQTLLAAIGNRSSRLANDLDLNEETREKFDYWYAQHLIDQYRQMAAIHVAAQYQQQQAANAVEAVAAASTHGHGKQQQQQQKGTLLANSGNCNGQTQDGQLNLSRRAVANCSNLLKMDMDGATLSNHLPTIHSSDIHTSLSSIHSHQAHQPPPPHHGSHHRSTPNPSPPQIQTSSSQSHSGGPQSQQYVRTRIRTSFDTEQELPKLHKWFSDNQHPSRNQIQQYVKELNSLECRKGRKPLDVNNVVYWFKNARAAHKRQELKLSNGSNSPSNCNNQILTNVNQDQLDGDVKDSRESNGNHYNGPMDDMDSDGHDDYGDEMDDECSRFSQTLDLSVRPEKRKRFDSSAPSSPSSSGNLNPPDTNPHSITNRTLQLHSHQDFLMRSSSPSNNSINSTNNNNSSYNNNSSTSANNNITVKEEQGTDDEEEDSDLDDKEYYSSSNHHKDLLSGGYSIASGNHPMMMDTDSHQSLNNNGNSQSQPDSPEEGRRVRRSRTFIDPMSEVPRLEQWFLENTHPTHSQIVQYTDKLNNLPYRLKFPKLEPKNIQFWFKNRRAKIKRLGVPSSSSSVSNVTATSPCTTSNNNNNNPASTSQQSDVSSVSPCSVSSASLPTQSSSPSSIHVSSAHTIGRLIGQ
ncbi:SATB1_N and homeodomain domain-containing protein dve [Brevipalpus obovatus]|uniref:SATB1_N and homeodomain domain-containing protein dve n=1 Tax=Brevipalpus obovatus TaxID=246614 RepID=UPI003D9EDE66